MSSSVNSTLLICSVAAFAGQRADLEFVALDRDEVEVVQVNRVAGVGDDRAHVAGEKIFVLADSEDERAAAPRADDEIGNIRDGPARCRRCR